METGKAIKCNLSGTRSSSNVQKLLYVCIFLLLFANSLNAEEYSTSKEWSVTIGAKAWYADWNSKASGSIRFREKIIFGPALSFRWKNFTFGGTYFSGNFKTSKTDWEYWYTGKRKDLDLFLGYKFTQYFSILTGFKSLQTVFDEHHPHGWGQRDIDQTLMGPALGASFLIPIKKSGLILHISLAYIYLDVQWETSTEEGNKYSGNSETYALSGECNLGYLLNKFYLSLGYRFQNLATYKIETYMSSEWINEEDYESNFGGPMLILLYQF